MLKKEGQDESYIKQKLTTIAEKLSNEKDINVEVAYREGNIFTTISEVAEEIGASLIFLGTHGKVGLQKLTGSFALKVVTSSPVPVIVVQKRQLKGQFSEVVLPITSDAGPWEKTQWATHIAKEFGSRILIYHLPGEKIGRAVKLITDYFDKQNVGYAVEAASKSGNFTKQVVDYSTTKNADMIMIMTNPDKGFSSFILGSYDEDLIFNTSQIPVMCINPRDLNWKKIVSY
jgi:nucleotide-binding universal stress UspA family protein